MIAGMVEIDDCLKENSLQIIKDGEGQENIGLLRSLSGYIGLTIQLGHIGCIECMMHIIFPNML